MKEMGALGIEATSAGFQVRFLYETKMLMCQSAFKVDASVFDKFPHRAIERVVFVDIVMFLFKHVP